MNIYQRIILVAGAIAVIFVLSTAPKFVSVSNGNMKLKIDATDSRDNLYHEIDVSRLAIREFAVIAVTILLYFSFGKLSNPHVKIPIKRFSKLISIPFVKLFHFFRSHKKIFISLFAVVIVVTVILITPFNEIGSYYIGRVLIRAEKYEKAIPYLYEVVNKKKGVPQYYVAHAHARIVLCLYRLGYEDFFNESEIPEKLDSKVAGIIAKDLNFQNLNEGFDDLRIYLRMSLEQIFLRQIWSNQEFTNISRLRNKYSDTAVLDELLKLKPEKARAINEMRSSYSDIEIMNAIIKLKKPL